TKRSPPCSRCAERARTSSPPAGYAPAGMGSPRTYDRMVGRSLGEFVLRERIGEGGFGSVYREIQPALDREAVVKVLHAKLHAAPAATERFLREARLASKLDHPYAAHIYA